MGGIVRSGNVLHDAACLQAELTRQSSVAGSPTQTVYNAAEITYHRSVIASCKQNNSNFGYEASLSALKSLGVNS